MPKNPQDFDANFDQLVDDLQRYVDQQDETDYSPYALELGKNPYKLRPLAVSPTIFVASAESDCHDKISLYLDIQDRVIVDVGFDLEGCTVISIACSQVLKLIEGKTVTEAQKIQSAYVIASLGKFPEESYHAIGFVMQTLRKILAQWK